MISISGACGKLYKLPGIDDKPVFEGKLRVVAYVLLGELET